ncbi:unnamed protein product [Symbiodinium sp. CCMP2592]|nr:unnamed protein product [Symbiodinium sp. CCMP2592]
MESTISLSIFQDLAAQKFRSILVMADSSPKGTLDAAWQSLATSCQNCHPSIASTPEVWSAVVYAGRCAASMPLQKLADLQTSTASVSTKLDEAQKVADNWASNVAQGREASARKLPKTLSRIKQKKLAAREQLRCVLHVLDILGLEMLLPTTRLRPVDLSAGEQRVANKNKQHFLWNPHNGEASWDAITETSREDLRLILAPDEGSSLYCSFAWMASAGFSVMLLRDELHKLSNHYLRVMHCNPGVARMYSLTSWLMKARKCPWQTNKVGNSWKEGEGDGEGQGPVNRAQMDDVLMQLFGSSILHESGYDCSVENMESFQIICEIVDKATKRNGATYSHSRWCSWGHCAKAFRKYYSSTLLAVFWSCMEEGLNPFAKFQPDERAEAGQKYQKALVDEEAHLLFEGLAASSDERSDVMCGLASKQSTKSMLGSLQEHTAFANSSSFDRRLDRLLQDALGPTGMARLQMDCDVELRANELVLTRRRPSVRQDLLRDFLDAVLSCIYEISCYRLYLLSAPGSCAGLLARDSSRVRDLDRTKTDILLSLKKEWSVVLELESSSAGAACLDKLCSYTKWQCYRELLVALHEADFKMDDTARSLVSSWFPMLTQSANIEEQFATIQDSVKRSCKNGKASMTALSSIAVKAVYHKLTDKEEQAPAVHLVDRDWEGASIRGQHVQIDKILSDFVSTSAHHHNKGGLNHMQAFIEAKKNGLELALASENFWVAGLIQKGMLISVNGQYYMSLGNNPGALRLRELELVFRGKRPAEAVDEEHVAARPPVWEIDDVLTTENDIVKALVIDGGGKINKLLLSFTEVQCFDFSVHCCDVKLATKLGTSLILRRALKAMPLLVSLIASRGILKITSDCLSRMINCYGQRLRKNASKSEKIRTLMRLPIVREALSEENLAKLEQILSDLDAKRRQKCSDAEQDEEDEEVWEMIAEPDAAWEGAEQMLEQLAAEEAAADQAAGAEQDTAAPEEASAQQDQAPPGAAERSRASRSMLSCTSTVPDFLLEKWGPLEGVTIYHTEHRDATRPLFQARLCSGQYKSKCLLSKNSVSLHVYVLSVRLISQGVRQFIPRIVDQPRASTAASYNPDLPVHELNESVKEVKQISPAHRSMSQAYFMVWCWASEAVKGKRARTD